MKVWFRVIILHNAKGPVDHCGVAVLVNASVYTALVHRLRMVFSAEPPEFMR